MEGRDGRLIGIPGVLSFHVTTAHEVREDARRQNIIATTEAEYELGFRGEVAPETRMNREKARSMFRNAKGQIDVEVLGRPLITVFVAPCSR